MVASRVAGTRKWTQGWHKWRPQRGTLAAWPLFAFEDKEQRLALYF